MTIVVDIPFVASLVADVNTDYLIESDAETANTFATVETINSTDRGDGNYIPYSTTLNGGIAADDTTIILSDGTNFSEDDYVGIVSQLGRELIQLGTKATHTFSNCVRSIGATLPQAWLTGATVYQAHELYQYSLASWPTDRYVVTVRITAITSDGNSDPLEIPIIKPPSPTDNELIVVWGLIDVQGVRQSGVTVRMVYGDNAGFFPGSGEHQLLSPVTTTTNEEGFWYFEIPRARVNGTYPIITVDYQGDGEIEFTIENLPTDANHVNIFET